MGSHKVHRFEFEIGDVIAALIDVPPRTDVVEMSLRDDGTTLAIDFYPVADFVAETTEIEKPPQKPVDAQGGGRTPNEASAPAKSSPAPAPARTVGPNEARAISTIAKKSFHLHYEVANAEEALAKLLRECRAQNLGDFDRDKHKRAAFLDVMGGFEAWLTN